ncbi:DUF1752 domain protein [Rutstroemia sp. NJR-2017a BBW]|nr:DUF1752 domain protein [Rutstroemia sp. NJR-2017a BBW]
MALILPKGIVVNSPQIGSTIERINTDPLDLADIAKFWKVYTTTKRRLLDPTAERLENYWWRIWGSQRRELNGATVARLFVHISDGETFVPLRGPPNRDESGRPLKNGNRLEKTASSVSVLRSRNSSRPNTTATSIPATRTAAAMPHPILKKTRGPSGNGPRPTARFISPAVSEDESNQPESSGSTNREQAGPKNERVEKVEKTDKKLVVVGPNKKFVASSAAKKKRPVIVRRQSSQTSQTSQSSNDSGTKPPDSTQSKALGRPPPLTGQPSRSTNLNENTVLPVRSSISPTKRSVSKSGSRSGSHKPLETTREEVPSVADNNSQEFEPPRQSKDLRVLANTQLTLDTVSEEDFKLQRMLDEDKKTATILPPGPPSPDSQSSNTSINSNGSRIREHREFSGKQLLQHQSKGSASLAPTLTAALGQLDLGTGLPSTVAASSPERAGKGKARALVKDLFGKKSAPLASVSGLVDSVGSDSSPVPESSKTMSKSKSQLSFVLERDRSRSAELNAPSKKGPKNK